MRRLSDCTQGRDNNFNVIRIVAALSVLFSHSYSLAGQPEPLVDSLHTTLGTIAVDVFFITSGFLVTASLLRRQDTGEFILARALRVFPALWVVLLLSVFVLGPALTEFPLSRYFTTPQTFIYPCRCASLFLGVSYTLPGVFEHNPFPKSVNGSLWTLTDEVRLYAILALVWFFLRKDTGRVLSRFKRTICILLFLTGACMLVANYHSPDDFLFARHYFMFFTGAMFFLFRERLVLSRWLFWPFFTCLSLSTLNKDAFFVTYVCTIAYVFLYLAYVPSGFIRKYNRLGDYSYGIYIYAFPVQQTLVALQPGISALKMIALGFPITTLLAVLSWHLLEKRALELKDYCRHHASRFFLSFHATSPR